MLRNTYCGKAPLAFGSEETSGVNIVVVWQSHAMNTYYHIG